jgi:hypothetical protein
VFAYDSGDEQLVLAVPEQPRHSRPSHGTRAFLLAGAPDEEVIRKLCEGVVAG